MACGKLRVPLGSCTAPMCFATSLAIPFHPLGTAISRVPRERFSQVVTVRVAEFPVAG